MTKTKNEIWRAMLEEKVNIMTDEHDREWVDKKDFEYLYLEYRSVLMSSFLLLFCILVLAIMYMLSGIK